MKKSLILKTNLKAGIRTLNHVEVGLRPKATKSLNVKAQRGRERGAQ
jgi:hypothetical protein